MPSIYSLFAVLLSLTSITFTLFCSIAIARVVSGNRNIMFLGTSVITLFFALQLAIFWILAPFNQFTNLNVFGLTGIAALSVRYLQPKGKKRSGRESYVKEIVKSLYLRPLNPICILSILSIMLSFLHMVAACVLPVMGWDFVAYRGFKAALFVQNEGLFNFGLPGGWQFYKLMPSNLEVIFSYFMLGPRNDVLVIILDFLLFIVVPLPVWAYCYQRTTPEWKWVQALLIWWLPLLREGVGFAQTETELTFFILAGMLFLLDFIREQSLVTLGMCGLSLGIAYGIKPLVLPQVIVFGIAICLVAFKSTPRPFRTLAVFLLSFLSLTLPWFLSSLIETGLPLSPLPISVFGFQLGSTTEAMVWNLSRVDAVPYEAFEEFGHFAKVFFTWDRLAFGYFGLAEIILLLAIIPYAWRNSRVTTSLCLSVFLSGVIAFFLPSMRLNRVFYYTGRYLVHSIAVLFFIFERPSRHVVWTLIPAVLVILLMLLAVPRTRYFPVSGHEMLAIIFLAIPVLLYLTRRFSVYLQAGVCICVLSLCTFLATSLRATSVGAYFKLFEDVNRDYYWNEALPMSLYYGNAQRIAVTHGPYKKLSNHLLYHFLGSRFQNRLFYIPPVPTEPGKPVTFPDPDKVATARNEWINQLISNKIDYVLSLKPKSSEIEILQSSPETFLPLIEHKNWGMFCVISVGQCKGNKAF